MVIYSIENHAAVLTLKFITIMDYTSIRLLTVALAVVLFIAGWVMLLRGYKKYGYSFAWTLAPFAGIIFSFPIYFALKEKALMKAGDDSAAKSAHKQLIAAVWAVAAGFLWVFVSGVAFFLSGFKTGDVHIGNRMQLIFIGICAICVLFLIAVLLLGRKK